MKGNIFLPSQPLIQPTKIPVNGLVRYANGVGVSDLGVTLTYYFSPTLVALGDYPDFKFGNGGVKLEDKKVMLQQPLPSEERPAVIENLVLDKKGMLSKDLGAEVGSNQKTIAENVRSTARPQNLVVRLKYQDQSGEFQTLSLGQTIYNSSQYVGVRLVSGDRKTARIQFAAVDTSGKSLTEGAGLQYKLFKVESKTISEQIFGGLIVNTVERFLKPKLWRPSCRTQSGVISCAVDNLASGTYGFEVTSTNYEQTANVMFSVDSAGNTVSDGGYFHNYDYGYTKQLELSLNKEIFKGGDRAVVSYSPPFKDCSALVTLERSEVIKSFVVSDACKKGSIEIPVSSELAPNAFVSVYLVTGRTLTADQALKVGDMDLGRPTYRLGYANLKVDWSMFTAKVIVSTDKPVYEPREEVKVSVTVQPEQGGLTDASVTVLAIEEKILEMKTNETYNLLNAMMRSRWHSVLTVTPLDLIETITGHQFRNEGGSLLARLNAGRKGGNEGGDGDSGSGPMKREFFDALVDFRTNVPVVNGVAKVSLRANDRTTNFKIVAIATSSDHKFGTGEGKYLTQKDTQAESNIPLVAYTGDVFPIMINLQNNSSKQQTYTAEILAVVKDSARAPVKTLTFKESFLVKPSQANQFKIGDIQIPDEASQIEYEIRILDELNKVVDVVSVEPQTILPTVPLAIHDSYIRQVDDSGSLSIALNKDKKALPTKGEIRAALSDSLVSGAVGQIRQRLTDNVFTDLLIESRFSKALLTSSRAHTEPIRKVLDELPAFLDQYGFVKYFPGSRQGSVWLTASLIHLLQSEPWAFKLVPNAVIEKWKSAVSLVLKKELADPKGYVGDSDMAWMRAQTKMGVAAFAFNDPNLNSLVKTVATAFAESLSFSPTSFGEPLDKWNNESLLDFWMLQVYSAPKSALSSLAYRRLTDPARLLYAGNGAVLRGAPGFWFDVYSDETIESSRLLLGLAVLSKSLGVNDLADLSRAIAVGVVNVSKTQWYSTVTMSEVARGLKVFAEAFESESVEGATDLRLVQAEKTMSAVWPLKTSSPPASLESPMVVAHWLTPHETVNVRHTGKGRPWLDIQALTAIALTGPASRGINLEKHVNNLSRVNGHKTGDVIEVTIKLHAGSSLSHVALLDPIPAGSNIVHEAEGFGGTASRSYRGYNVYIEHLPSGVIELKYKFQLNNPGTFNLPPTRAEGLYMPSIYGELPNSTLTVEEVR